MRSALVLVAVATLTLAACSSKSTDSGSSSSATSAAESGSAAASGSETAASGGGALKIVPIANVDTKGKEVAAVADLGKPADPAGDGKATCSGINIAMAGPLTGANANLGLNILRGAQLAIEEHNAANAGCQVEIKQFDTEGKADKATPIAPSIISDKSVIGLLGPAFSGETLATGPKFFEAGLLSLTASATRADLTTNGWTNFFRGLGNDLSQGGAGAAYMTDTLGFKKICVVSDNTPYGQGLAANVIESLGAVADENCRAQVKEGDKDFSATVSLIKGESPDAVYYAGYYPEAAPFVSQLRDGGVTVPFVAGDGVDDTQFVQQAGSASKGAYLTCPCAPAPDDFKAAYLASSGAEPGIYSVEAYDLTTIMQRAIDSGITTRAALIDYVKNYDGVGLGKAYKWDSSGELGVTNPWVYKVE
jgi:branched-chain amino acid transport system substrate-binding protein